MGRGLSPLQVWILKRAADSPEKDASRPEVALYSNRIVREFYGVRGAPGHRFQGPFAGDAAKHRPSITRALRRLEARGLIEVTHWVSRRSGGVSVALTDEGRAVADRLATPTPPGG